MANRSAGALLAALLLGACDTGTSEIRGKAGGRAAQPAIGLMSTLPIYWPESAEFGDILRSDTPPGWVRLALERRGTLGPLDTLEDAALARLDLLVLAQPRALSAPENVALDAWVRQGGRALVFADPMLTGHSLFPVGDRRRPQDVALLSPILGRWGLELTYDADQVGAERPRATVFGEMPVHQAGALRERPGAAGAECQLGDEGLVARCAVGSGRVVVVADAALLEEEGEGKRAQREAVLAEILDAALGA